MKEFNLEEAKAGKPVYTRDGRKARIICFDRKCTKYPIVALVEDSNGIENAWNYTNDGKFDINHNTTRDLVMVSEKHEGWINIYRGRQIGTTIWKTKNEAELNACEEGPLDTIKIEWEE